MTFYSPPTHIDFITRYKDTKKHDGYWIMTWISYGGSVNVWRRLKKGWEHCNRRVGDKDWFEIIGRDPKFYNFYVESKYEYHAFLEKTLHDYMKDNDIKGEPYEYFKPYKDKNEADKEDIRRNPGKYIQAHTDMQLKARSKYL